MALRIHVSGGGWSGRGALPLYIFGHLRLGISTLGPLWPFLMPCSHGINALIAESSSGKHGARKGVQTLLVIILKREVLAIQLAQLANLAIARAAPEPLPGTSPRYRPRAVGRGFFEELEWSQTASLIPRPKTSGTAGQTPAAPLTGAPNGSSRMQRNKRRL